MGQRRRGGFLGPSVRYQHTIAHSSHRQRAWEQPISLDDALLIELFKLASPSVFISISSPIPPHLLSTSHLNGKTGGA